jgi:hypothetical protein
LPVRPATAPATAECGYRDELTPVQARIPLADFSENLEQRCRW